MRVRQLYDHRTNDCIVMILIWMLLGAQAHIKDGETGLCIFLCNSHISPSSYFSREHDLFEMT